MRNDEMSIGNIVERKKAYMFDWFREVFEEVGGIDPIQAKKERKEKKEEKKLNIFIFSKKMKILFIVLGLLYIIMAGSTVAALKETEGALLYIIKYIMQSIIAMIVIFALIFGKKKGEIVAVIGSFIFALGMFLSIVFS